MKLSDILAHLTGSEFSQLALVDQATGTVADNKLVTVLGYVNLGLTALHRRFFLKENRLQLQTLADRNMYPLNSSYAVAAKVSRVLAGERFILDSAAAPFRDDVLKVEQVFRDGCAQELNKGGELYTPSNTVLHVPVYKDDAGQVIYPVLELAYRANHPLIVKGLGLFDPTKIEIDLPASHVEALLYFIGSRATTPLGVSGNNFSMGNSYLGKYEAACKELENTGANPDRHWGSSRFEDNGWA